MIDILAIVLAVGFIGLLCYGGVQFENCCADRDREHRRWLADRKRTHYPLAERNYYDADGKWCGYEAEFDITKETELVGSDAAPSDNKEE